MNWYSEQRPPRAQNMKWYSEHARPRDRAQNIIGQDVLSYSDQIRPQGLLIGDCAQNAV